MKTTDAKWFNAHRNLRDAVENLKIVKQDIGQGPGGREVALALTKAEEALLWYNAGGELTRE